MSRHQHVLPAGCHDAESAAELLGVSKRELLRRMRALGWLTGGDKTQRNLPRRELIDRGLLCTQDRSYCLKGKSEIGKNYRVMLLTQAGYRLLEQEMENYKPGEKSPTPEAGKTQAPAKPTPVPHEMPRPRTSMTADERAAADRERKKVLAELAQMGLTG